MPSVVPMIALISASTSLPPDSFTLMRSPTLKALICAGFYHAMLSRMLNSSPTFLLHTTQEVSQQSKKKFSDTVFLTSSLDELQTFAVSRLTDIRKLIAHPESIDQARAALAEHFGAFTLEPISREGKATYLAHGKVRFLWGRWRERVVPGPGSHHAFQRV